MISTGTKGKDEVVIFLFVGVDEIEHNDIYEFFFGGVGYNAIYIDHTVLGVFILGNIFTIKENAFRVIIF